jgi:uncharacterized membrane protein YhaH (DUF805 family)
MYSQDDLDRAFDLRFESHEGGYLVFTRRGGSIFSAQERAAYRTKHRNIRPSFWKIFAWTVAGCIALALVEFVAINVALMLWSNSPLRTNLIVAAVLLPIPGLFLSLLASFTWPHLTLQRQLDRDADSRPLAAPPRPTTPLVRRLPNFVAFLGILAFSVALAGGWAQPTWQWVLTGCTVMALVIFALLRAPKKK